MRKVKHLSEYQKGIYGEILGEFFNPIFSTTLEATAKVAFLLFKGLFIKKTN
ncbi:hypothetical protein [Pedobacter mucosus]|uniref:hypothetical protein n=1 Tax=Pedobacter mucosus TaxID=2895286 RepID=UPI001EE3BD83|nr:hypothetical protein [Pedobacter mucosus]UKT62698.1 hypothetical protein LOK61_13105 [Pedobacter mucosus]